MSESARFKIDANKYSTYCPFALFSKRSVPGWFRARTEWEFIESFQTIDEARALYQRIKALPEYLP